MPGRKKNKKRDKRKRGALLRLAAKKKLASKTATAGPKSSRRKTARKKSKPRGKPALVDLVSFETRGLGARSGGQAGDVQGLSGVEGAASESVEELLEEGNAYEADVVKGVEDAERADEMEVETHEVPEDDVPGEYRDRD